MSYIDEGFDNNLIRAGYSAEADTAIDSVNIGSMIVAGAIGNDQIAGVTYDKIESVPFDIRGWSTDIAFTQTDHDTLSWGSGSIFLADGTEYSIDAGNTGNITELTYVFFDTDVSITELQTATDAEDAIGGAKILVAVCQDVDSGRAIEYQSFGGKGVGQLITATSIAAGTITADEIATNTITASRMTVSTLSSITANLGTITAGTINSATINTDEIYDETYGLAGVFVKTIRQADTGTNTWLTLTTDGGGLLSVFVNYTTDSDSEYKLLPSFNTSNGNSYYRVEKVSGSYKIYLEMDDIGDDISSINYFYVTALYNSNESATSF